MWAMGIVIGHAIFDSPAPDLSRIAEKIQELSGLAVTVEESGPEIKGDLYDFHAQLAFTGAPETQLKIWAYRPDARKEFYQRTFGDQESPFFTKMIRGINEPPNTQAVHLQGYIGQEQTLFVMTQLALEAIGGHSPRLISEQMRQDYGKPITPAQLKARHRKWAREMFPLFLIGFMLLPPLILIGVLGFLITLPWRIRKGHQIYRTIMSENN
jgi:hypothetical protein